MWISLIGPDFTIMCTVKWSRVTKQTARNQLYLALTNNKMSTFRFFCYLNVCLVPVSDILLLIFSPYLRPISRAEVGFMCIQPEISMGFKRIVEQNKDEHSQR